MKGLALNLKLCYLTGDISKGKALSVNVFKLFPGKAFKEIQQRNDLVISFYLLFDDACLQPKKTGSL